MSSSQTPSAPSNPAPAAPAAPSTPSTGGPAPQAPAQATRGQGRGRGNRGRGRGGNNRPSQTTTTSQPGTSPVAVSTPNSAAPTFTGWGTPNVTLERREVRRQFSVSAAGFLDLVNAEYLLMTSKHSRHAQQIPRGLFVYTCCLAWWYRILHIKAHNYRLSTQEREFMRAMEHLENTTFIPERIHQYLTGLGNFSTNGEQFELMFDDFDFSANLGAGNTPGFVNTPAGRRTNATTMWVYAHCPVPGVLFTEMIREYHVASGTGNPPNLGNIAPAVASFPGANLVTPTDNILGYHVNTQPPLHASWDDTYNRLGIRAAPAVNNIIRNAQTISNWLLNPEMLRWTSEKIATCPDYKSANLSKIRQNTTGSYFQISYIQIPEYRMALHPTPQMDADYKATNSHPMQLISYNPVSSAHLGPALGCAYRYWIRFGTINNVAGVTHSAPWIASAAANVMVTIPVAGRVAANAWFSRLPAEYATSIYQTGVVERGILLHSILS